MTDHSTHWRNFRTFRSIAHNMTKAERHQTAATLRAGLFAYVAAAANLVRQSTELEHAARQAKKDARNG